MNCEISRREKYDIPFNVRDGSNVVVSIGRLVLIIPVDINIEESNGLHIVVVIDRCEQEEPKKHLYALLYEVQYRLKSVNSTNILAMLL